LEHKGIKVLTLHSQLAKKIRLQNYSLFRDSENGILLSTDLGARGLDFPKLHRVINYDFPGTLCDYLQRVGRTGRAVHFMLNIGF
jgi:superfamily II DNA/RNA helicase